MPDTTPVPAAATGLPTRYIDLEDQILRVRWMSEIAHEHLDDIPADRLGDEFDKLCHLVRATSELAEQLHRDFQAVTLGRAA